METDLKKIRLDFKINVGVLFNGPPAEIEALLNSIKEAYESGEGRINLVFLKATTEGLEIKEIKRDPGQGYRDGG